MEQARFHALVSGEVQMVGFRAFAEFHAGRLGVRGWVRNLETGQVEILAEGSRDALDSFLDLIRRGPRLARVSGVQVRWEQPQQEPEGFTVRY
jgi:acylphosphatase